MRRAMLFLFLAVFVYLIIAPNVGMMQAPEYKVPETENITKVVTSEDLMVQQCTSKAKICIDAAKGGEDAGYEAAGHILEKDLNLALAKAIGAKLEAAGYQVVYTRESDDMPSYDSEEVSSAARVAMAKDMDADYLLSIQLSASSNSLIKGFCLFTQPDEVPSQLAQAIASRLNAINFTQFQGMDNDHYSNFPILNDRSLPSIIVNFGYLTSSEDLSRLCDETYQSKIGQAVASAFLESVD